MPFTLDDNNAVYQIHAYRPGQIQINDKTFQQSVIVSPTTLINNWPPNTITELLPEHLTIMLTLKPSILLLGTGEKLIFPPIEVYGNLINHGIGVEIMDTRAACRTYNALSAEQRHVVAALLIR